ncbi:ricin B lectin domain-containing protein [Mycena olivaceomarginata]|nr:ricin B lectin domain-containing protein [Mycena olivaceomarginata]
MISTTLVALLAIRSLCLGPLQCGDPGLHQRRENVDGEPVVIHDCNTEDLTLQDWTATFACLDVTGGVNTLGTKLQIWTCSGGPNQQWVNTLDGTFQWSGTDKCIDLTDGKIMDGNQLQLYTCSSTNTNQKWGSDPNPDNGGPQIILGGRFCVNLNSLITYLATNQAEPVRGQPFCVGAASNADGAAVVLLGCGIGNAGPNFPNGNYNWTAPFAPLTGTIKTFNNKCLDVPNRNNANGQKLQIWTCADGNTNQQFTIHANPNTIKWKGTGKCLDLTNGNSTIGNPMRPVFSLIQLWDCNGANINQEWQLDTVQAF